MLSGSNYDMQVNTRLVVMKLKDVKGFPQFRQVTRLQPELVSEEKCSTKPKTACQLRTDAGKSVFDTKEKPLIQRFCLNKRNFTSDELNVKVPTLNMNDNITNSVEKFAPLPLDRARMLISDEFSTGVNNLTPLDGKVGFTESKLLTDLEASSSDSDLNIGLEKEKLDTYQREMQLGLGLPQEETTSSEFLFLEETTLPENWMMYDTTTTKTMMAEKSTTMEIIGEEVSETQPSTTEDETATEVSVTYSESSSEKRHVFSFLPNSTAASK